MGDQHGEHGMEDQVRELQSEADELWEGLLAGRNTLWVARHMVKDYVLKGGAETNMPQYLETIAGMIGNLSELRVPVAQLIEKAVLAEREACARLAWETAGGDHKADRIAEAITARPMPKVTDTDCDLTGITP